MLGHAISLSHGVVPRARSIALAVTLVAGPTYSGAQTLAPPTADSSGIGTVVANPSLNTYTVTGGTRCIATGCSTTATTAINLFHSFATFDVPTGAVVLFGGPAGTTNVISRVTGGHFSTIDGRISTRTNLSTSTPPVTAMTSANFFLINPAGVMFGANARLDLGGSFYVATADQVKFADGKVFSAAPPSGEVLTFDEPRKFGFLGNSPAAITIDGFGRFGTTPSGKTVSIVGGNVTIRGPLAQTQVRAPSGRVEIASVASLGDVNFGTADLFPSSVPAGEVTISSGALVNAAQGGTVVIRSGKLTIDQATVSVDTFNTAGPAVGVDLRASESMVVRGNTAVVKSEAFGTGSGSGISIVAGTLSVTSGGACPSAGCGIQTQAFGGATGGNGGRIDIAVGSADIIDGKIRTISAGSRAGDIRVVGSGTVTVAGPTGEISTVKNTATTAPLAGDILVNAQDVVLRDGAKIQSGARTGQVAGANLSVTAANTVSISGLAGISSQTSRPAGGITLSAVELVMDSGFINTSTHGAANAGPVLINANNVSLANGAQIASSSQLGTTGAGGSITINAPGSVTINGIGAGAGVGAVTFSGSPNSGLFSTAGGTGNAGQIAISTPTLTIADGGKISVVTTAAGNAGTIAANISNFFALTGGGRIESNTTAAGAGGAITLTATQAGSIAGLGSGIFSTASSTGNAGQIAVTAPALTMTDGAKISVATQGTGSAGTITINAGTASLSGGARIDSSTTAGGAGGGLTVNGTGSASSVSIAGSGTGLFSTASSTGNAGSIGVSTGNVVIASGGTIDSSTTGAGAGGAINVTAASQVDILDGASIRADSLGSGTTGDINVTAGTSIVMNNGTISTNATTADGGNIKLTAPHMVQLSGSQITTSVASGTGSGGNISIDPEFVILKGSSITANAFGGPGGNVTIVANTFLSDVFSVVEASSALSTPGTVQILSPDNNVASDIAQLPGELVDASRLLQGACSARRAGAPSSFTVAGRGGVPVDPDGYLPSFYASGAPFAGAPSAAAGQGFAVAMAGWDCWR